MRKGQAHDLVVKACWEWAVSNGYQFDSYLSHMKTNEHMIGEHFGFGVGIDRVVQCYMGERDIRRAAAFLVV